jgi:carbon-monoxide dehydrogenase large subunit
MPRIEDARLLTGNGRYTGDIAETGMLHAVFLRSDRPHAEIRAIDTAGAAASPGVVAVLTGADTAAENLGSFPSAMPFRGRGGAELFRPPRPVLAQGRVRYVGEPVALVIAASAAQALDAAELIGVDYAELPAVTDPLQAASEQAPALWPELRGNVCFDWEAGEASAVQAAFAAAAHVTTVEMKNTRLAGNPMEPSACIARFDVEGGGLTLICGSQGASNIRDQLCAVLRLPADQLRVISGDVGGGFGIKAHAYVEYAALAIAARRLSRPVKWTCGRNESFLADHHGRDSVVTARLALDGDGRFLAMQFSFVANMGAYLSGNGALIMTKNTAQAMAGVYRTPAIHGRVRCVFSNTNPTGPYRGAGRPEMAYAIERLVDQAAAELGIDRVELRRRNLVRPTDMPYRTPTGSVYDSGHFEALLDRALLLSGWSRFDERRRASERRGKLRGIGLALFLEGTGSAPRERVSVGIEEDGCIGARCGTQSSGQGHETVFAALLARRLGIGADQVRLVQGDTLRSPGGPSVASRSLHAAGPALVAACDGFIAQGRALAARLLDANEDSVTFAEGRYAGGGRSIGLAELLLTLAPAERAAWCAQGEVEVHPTYPNGCHVAEVEIDPETGTVVVCDYSCADDFGVISDETIVEGQLHGGIAQGLGEVLMEGVAYDPDSGQLLTGSLMDYAMPKSDGMPPIRSEFLPVPCTTNTLGSKGAGEAGTTGAVCALMSALLDAARGRGVTALDKPVSPPVLWRALRGDSETA